MELQTINIETMLMTIIALSALLAIIGVIIRLTTNSLRDKIDNNYASLKDKIDNNYASLNDKIDSNYASLNDNQVRLEGKIDQILLNFNKEKA